MRGRPFGSSGAPAFCCLTETAGRRVQSSLTARMVTPRRLARGKRCMGALGTRTAQTRWSGQRSRQGSEVLPEPARSSLQYCCSDLLAVPSGPSQIRAADMRTTRVRDRGAAGRADPNHSWPTYIPFAPPLVRTGAVVLGVARKNIMLEVHA